VERYAALIKHVLESETDRHLAAQKAECILRHAAGSAQVAAEDRERNPRRHDDRGRAGSRQGGTAPPDEPPPEPRFATGATKKTAHSLELFADGGWFLIGRFPP
jgi:hypothetical protein